MDRLGSTVSEELRGEGPVYEEGEHLCRARYRITVLQEWIEPAPTYERIDGLKEISGSVEAIDDTYLFGRDKLTIELEDGRRMDLFLVDNGGRIANRGRQGLYRP